MVVIMDDEDRENEGDLVMAAARVMPRDINFMARYGRGLICLTLCKERCHQLRLPLMVQDNFSRFGTRFTVSIDASDGIATGISAADRAATIQKAVAPHAKPEDFVQPGHVFPLMAEPGGVLYRAGHTEAGCDLAHLCGFFPAAVIVEILNEDGTMARRADLEQFANQHGLKIGTISDLIHYRLTHEKTIERVVETDCETEYGVFRLLSYVDTLHGQSHIAFTLGSINPDEPVLVRVHLEDSLEEVLGVKKEGVHWSLSSALQKIKHHGQGVVVILGKDKPLTSFVEQQTLSRNKARLDETSLNTLDVRTIGVGCQILHDLGVRKMKVMSAPKRFPGLAGFQLEVVEYVPYVAY
ncbi:MAG: 3,4-dihydroxy-2-butanone-4-phosphate synthase [Gammaproteobacteria bacterium]|nr:3,4-dihydroxy-2-butanone-4-phosphate synthase [Gammaproteobacteria bacterium]